MSAPDGTEDDARARYRTLLAVERRYGGRGPAAAIQGGELARALGLKISQLAARSALRLASRWGPHRRVRLAASHSPRYAGSP